MSWVLDSLTSALGNAFLYSGMCPSVAYLSPKPPLKMITSSGALGSTPSGLLPPWAPPEDAGVEPPPPPVAHASSRPAAGRATRLTAAARCRTVRRLTLGLAHTVGSTASGFSGESDILVSSGLGQVVRRTAPPYRDTRGGFLIPTGDRGRSPAGPGTRPGSYGSSFDAQWPATARAVAWNAASDRTCVRCATAMYTRSSTPSWGGRPGRASGRDLVACLACSRTMHATSASGERGKLVRATVV